MRKMKDQQSALLAHLASSKETPILLLVAPLVLLEVLPVPAPPLNVLSVLLAVMQKLVAPHSAPHV